MIDSANGEMGTAETALNKIAPDVTALHAVTGFACP
jgi:hypothetical protein